VRLPRSIRAKDMNLTPVPSTVPTITTSRLQPARTTPRSVRTPNLRPWILSPACFYFFASLAFIRRLIVSQGQRMIAVNTGVSLRTVILDELRVLSRDNPLFFARGW
jgi:hypothetical protein